MRSKGLSNENPITTFGNNNHAVHECSIEPVKSPGSYINKLKQKRMLFVCVDVQRQILSGNKFKVNVEWLGGFSMHNEYTAGQNPSDISEVRGLAWVMDSSLTTYALYPIPYCQCPELRYFSKDVEVWCCGHRRHLPSGSIPSSQAQTSWMGISVIVNVTEACH